MDAARFMKEEIKKRHADVALFAVAAQEQLQGRGRGGSSWAQTGVEKSVVRSPLDYNDAKYFLSVADCFSTQNEILPLTLVVPASAVKIPSSWLSLATGCALIDAMSAFVTFFRSTFSEISFAAPAHPLQLKWPNDVVYRDDKTNAYLKISGILCEAVSCGASVDCFFIGIGMNFFTSPLEIENSSSLFSWLTQSDSLKKHDQKRLIKLLSDTAVRRALVQRFSTLLEKELAEYLLAPRSALQLQSLALARLFEKGTHISVNKGQVRGEFAGLHTDGSLLLKGQTQPIYAGDIEALCNQNVEPSPTTVSKPRPEKPVDLHKEEGQSLIVALDLGNSRMHWTLGAAPCEIFCSDHIAYEALANETEVTRCFRPLLQHLRAQRTRTLLVPIVAVCSRPQKEEALLKFDTLLSRMLPELKRFKTEFTARDFVSLTRLNYESNELGADRALRYVHAIRQAQVNKESVAVFSFGTASTVEVVSAGGDIIESGIVPGLQMSLNALATQTALLPQIQFTDDINDPKTWNTKASLLRGSVFQAAGFVHAIILKYKPTRIFFSGGNAQIVYKILQRDFAEFVNGTCVEVDPTLETKMLITLAGEVMTPPQESEQRLMPSLASGRSGGKSKPDTKLRAMDDSRKQIKISTSLAPQANVAPWLLKTMLKARFNRRLEDAVTRKPKQDEFRRIGGRLENVDIGLRFDRYLAKHYPFLSRNLWRERIVGGEVLVEHNSPQTHQNNSSARLTPVKHTYRIQPFDQIWLFHPPELEPESVNECEVLFDDGDVVAFSKPGNLVIHATGMYVRNTFIQCAQNMGYSDVAPVHRIDRETSGLLLCARQSRTRSLLSAAFRNTEMKKMYLAVTRGPTPSCQKFRVDAPIGEAVGSRIRLKMWVNTPNALPATTDFLHVTERDGYHLFACFPRTGRTNQIRIHLASLGHWIVGDKMYHPNEDVFIDFYENGLTDWALKELEFPRHLLHNAAIQLPVALLQQNTIVSPVTSDFLEFAPAKTLLRSSEFLAFGSDEKTALLALFQKGHDAPPPPSSI